jgi:hypothetical protein
MKEIDIIVKNQLIWRKSSSEIWRHVILVRTDVSVAATCSLYSRRDSSALKMEAIRSSETSVLTKATRRQIPEDDFIHSHRRENLKSYNQLICS